MEERLKLVAAEISREMQKGSDFISLVHKKLRAHGIKTNSDNRGLFIYQLGAMVSHFQ